MLGLWGVTLYSEMLHGVRSLSESTWQVNELVFSFTSLGRPLRTCLCPTKPPGPGIAVSKPRRAQTPGRDLRPSGAGREGCVRVGLARA